MEVCQRYLLHYMRINDLRGFAGIRFLGASVNVIAMFLLMVGKAFFRASKKAFNFRGGTLFKSQSSNMVPPFRVPRLVLEVVQIGRHTDRGLQVVALALFDPESRHRECHDVVRWRLAHALDTKLHHRPMVQYRQPLFKHVLEPLLEVSDIQRVVLFGFSLLAGLPD